MKLLIIMTIMYRLLDESKLTTIEQRMLLFLPFLSFPLQALNIPWDTEITIMRSHERYRIGKGIYIYKKFTDLQALPAYIAVLARKTLTTCMYN